MNYVFTMDSGLQVPVTNLFDIDGEETDNPNEAVSLVAELPNGMWLATECKPHEIIAAPKPN